MLDIKHNNLFVGGSSATYGMSKVLDFYDLSGINWIFVHRSTSNTKHIMKSKCVVYTPSNIRQIFANGNNLFRVDLVVVESHTDIIDEIRKYVKVPIIIISSSYQYFNLKKYDCVYEFKTIKSGIPTGNLTSLSSLTIDRNYLIRDVITDNETDLNSLHKSKIRDIKINSIFNNNNI